MEENRTNSGPELLVSFERGSGRPLRAQLEDALRAAVQQARLHPGDRLPSTRALAGDLGCARSVVVDAFAQLAAEGYLVARAGAGTVVAPRAGAGPRPAPPPQADPAYRFDFRPGVPDLRLFPRVAWRRATTEALESAPAATFGYIDPAGARPLRQALAGYLARVRGVAVSADGVMVVAGIAHGLGLLYRALRAAGVAEMAIEEPGGAEQRMLVRRSGLEPVPVDVDGEGLRVDDLERTGARAVLVTPAHQFPLGAVLSPRRRAALLDWARRRNGLIVEDDYDAEYRYDRRPVGAVQGLAPDRVCYLGTTSKTLAPGLRLGWLVAPPVWAGRIAEVRRSTDLGTSVVDQLALARLIGSGNLDRHLRRTRPVYRDRRDALVRALNVHLPGAAVSGVAAGLHAVVRLAAGTDEQRVVRSAARRSIRVAGLSPAYLRGNSAGCGLVLGYAGVNQSAMPEAIRLLAEAVHET